VLVGLIPIPQSVWKEFKSSFKKKKKKKKNKKKKKKYKKANDLYLFIDKISKQYCHKLMVQSKPVIT